VVQNAYLPSIVAREVADAQVIKLIRTGDGLPQTGDARGFGVFGANDPLNSSSEFGVVGANGTYHAPRSRLLPMFE